MGPPSAEGFRERRYTAQDGLSLYYRDYGDPLSAARPLLCLAGLTRNAEDFHDFAIRQAARRRVVCPDYRGRGHSDHDPDWRNYRPEVYLGDLFHLFAAADLHGVAVCGVSLGGLLAMGLAVVAPAAMAGVILNDAGPELHPEGLDRIRDYVGHDHPQPDIESATAYLKKLHPSLVLSGERAWRSFAEATFKAGADGLLHVNWDVNLARTLGGELRDLWPYFRALRPLPVLALRGANSDILTAETLERMAKEKPDLERVTVPEAGHVPPLDHPEVEPAIDDFLDQLDRRS